LESVENRPIRDAGTACWLSPGVFDISHISRSAPAMELYGAFPWTCADTLGNSGLDCERGDPPGVDAPARPQDPHRGASLSALHFRAAPRGSRPAGSAPAGGGSRFRGSADPDSNTAD
jgi:hypothetical protein